MGFILHLESSTSICSICISQNNTLIALQESMTPQAHAGQITLLIEACLKQANISLKDLDAIAFSEGPGSYTGLRIGLSTAKGICYALNKPLISVNTLQSLALASRQTKVSGKTLYAPMIDARRMEVYTALYTHEGEELLAPHALIVDSHAFETYFEQGYTIVFSGNGAEKCQSTITTPKAIFTTILCSAQYLIPLSHMKLNKYEFSDVAYAEPSYIKAPNITTPKKRL